MVFTTMVRETLVEWEALVSDGRRVEWVNDRVRRYRYKWNSIDMFIKLIRNIFCYYADYNI